MEYTCRTSEETQRIAAQIAKSLKGGEVLGLVGDLGAGKTTFTQGLAKALGVKQTVTSPTFVLMKVYPVYHPTIKHFCHIDAYRLTSHEDLVSIGALDYINAPDCVTVIEWADRIEKILPTHATLLKFEPNNNSRIITY